MTAECLEVPKNIACLLICGNALVAANPRSSLQRTEVNRVGELTLTPSSLLTPPMAFLDLATEKLRPPDQQRNSITNRARFGILLGPQLFDGSTTHRQFSWSKIERRAGRE